MAMISMKISKDTDDASCADGLCIHLSEEQVEALGLDKKLPAEGATVNLRAIATVRRVTKEAESNEADADDLDADGIETEEQGEGREAGVALELHVTDMEVTQPGKPAAAVLYGGGE